MTETALLLVDTVKRRGKGAAEVLALAQVNLELSPGEVVLLEGPSGSGKTTLLGVAAGLLRPDSGEVWIDGQPLAGLSSAELCGLRAARVGFVFQRANLLGRLSLLDNVSLAARLAGRSAREAEAEARELLDQLGLSHLQGRRPHQVSGGEEQRTALARALVHRPRLVLADEPTANLDSKTGTRVAEQLRALATQRGAGVLIATHDQRLVPYADRSLRLEDGRMVRIGTAREAS